MTWTPSRASANIQPFTCLAKTLASPETIITLRGVGVIRIVSDSGNEYVLAHELMHTVLRRNNFPHWTGRLLRASYDAVMGFLGQLESTALHPAINKRLRDYQLDLPSTQIATWNGA
jgi:hypothetical protein